MRVMDFEELKFYLDEKVEQYNHPDFVASDPISIPHRFTSMQDVEISGFLSATIAWGNRKSIVRSANRIMKIMEESPYDFVMNVSEKQLEILSKQTVHRTFQGEDLVQFIKYLRNVYTQYSSMEDLFLLKEGEVNFYHSLERFRTAFLGNEKHRSHKHVSSTYKKAAAKRLMMFLRWMVRKDKKGVDLGIWSRLSPRYLSIPLDVHTANISRKLGLITRKSNDWKTVEELDMILRKMDSEDPGKYDFALFGIGINKELEFRGG